MVRRNRNRINRHQGIATIEVVLATGLIIPSLIYLLYRGFLAISAFLSLLGTMVGSPLN